MNDKYALWFDSLNGDRKYHSEDLRDYFSLFTGNGIYGQSTLDFLVTPVKNTQINVSKGYCFINGAIRFFNDLQYTLNYGDSIYPRYDAIVLRFDLTQRNVVSLIVQGTPSSNPVIPQPVRSGDYWDLIIAHIYVPANLTTITEINIIDRRGFAEYCPYVYALIKNVDTTGLFAQYEASWVAFVDSLADGEKVFINTADEQARKEIKTLQADQPLRNKVTFI